MQCSGASGERARSKSSSPVKPDRNVADGPTDRRTEKEKENEGNKETEGTEKRRRRRCIQNRRRVIERASGQSAGEIEAEVRRTSVKRLPPPLLRVRKREATATTD